MVCSLGEVVLCVIRNFVMYNKHFRLDDKNIKPVTLSGVIVNSLIILTCLISTTAFYASFYWVVKDNFVEYWSEGSENEEEEEASAKERILSFSDDDIVEYNNLKKNQEIERFLEKSKLEETNTKRKKKRNRDGFSTAKTNNNNKTFDSVDENTQNAQSANVTKEDTNSTHAIIIEQ